MSATRNATRTHGGSSPDADLRDDPGAQLRTRPVPGPWGWAVPQGGRAASVTAGVSFRGTTIQTCGLFPFASGSGATPPGVPVGRHMLTAEPVGFDTAAWLTEGLVTNTTTWVQGQPGCGKSTIVKRLLTGLVAFGWLGVVPGDTKGEYSELITHLGGQVWRLGRGLHALNPLDAGPLPLRQIAAGGVAGHRLAETIRARRLSLLEALTVIVRRTALDVTERRLLGVALDLIVDADPLTPPLIPDVVRILSNPYEELLSVTAAATPAEYLRDSRALRNALWLLCGGAIRGVFDRPSTIRADLDAPALSLDISALGDHDDALVATAMLCSWTWATSLVDDLEDAEDVPGPRWRRHVLRILDELWRALRVAPGLVELADAATRLGRHRGEATVMVTHSLRDLEALPTEEDRAKAAGLAARSGTLVLGGMDDDELDRVRAIAPMTIAERRLVRGWAAPPTWATHQVHPGRGKYLIKRGDGIGLPVQLVLTATERRLYDTDRAWRQP